MQQSDNKQPRHAWDKHVLSASCRRFVQDARTKSCCEMWWTTVLGTLNLNMWTWVWTHLPDKAVCFCVPNERLYHTFHFYIVFRSHPGVHFEPPLEIVTSTLYGCRESQWRCMLEPHATQTSRACVSERAIMFAAVCGLLTSVRIWHQSPMRYDSRAVRCSES